MDLGFNAFTGTIPRSLGYPLISYLYLENNSLSGTIPGFVCISELAVLYVTMIFIHFSFHYFSIQTQTEQQLDMPFSSLLSGKSSEHSMWDLLIFFNHGQANQGTPLKMVCCGTFKMTFDCFLKKIYDFSKKKYSNYFLRNSCDVPLFW